jgi:Flp pilus assembly protein TadD
MYACPYCTQAVQDFELRCPRCEGDLRTIALLHEWPDALFNQALQAAHRGDWTTATHRLGALLTLRGGDHEAWLLLGLVHARRGHVDSARECLQMVSLLKPGEPRAQDALAKLRVFIESQPSPKES